MLSTIAFSAFVAAQFLAVIRLAHRDQLARRAERARRHRAMGV